MLGRVPGFVSFVMFETGDSVVSSMCICDGPAALDEADRVADGWLAPQLGPGELRLTEAASGEVLLQRGL
jgi:hypothetical protein